jgi:hypothetical protein
MIAAALLLSVVITSVTPSSGPAGTTITIRGSGIGVNVTQVSVGRPFQQIQAASFSVIDADTIQAVTPPYFPGPADVTVFFRDAESVSMSNAFTYTGAVSDAFDRILLPLFISPVSGAFGSVFITSFSIWNTAGTDVPVFAFAPPPCQLGLCPPQVPLVLFLKARDGAPVISLMMDGDPGRLVYVPKGAFDRLAASLRVADRSRSAESFGTRIPIVPEREFRSDFLALLDIPMNASFRNTLRIYSLDPGTSVHVRVIRYDSTLVISDMELALRDPIDLFHPGYAQIADVSGEDHARIEITPSDGKRIWAFVSVTNNGTQQITIVAPH